MAVTFTITPRGPFSLEQAAGFGFGPNEPSVFDGTMRLAFCVDGYRTGAGVALTQSADGSITASAETDAPEEVIRTQVERILSLDHDGDLWQQTGTREPTLGALQQRYPGLRPVLFHSPYEAAAWAIISTRRGRRQAICTREEICETLGDEVYVAGTKMWTFPCPEQLLELDEIPGVGGARLDRLHNIAAAARDGVLDASRLKTLGPAAAATEVQELPGLGPFYSALVTIRATGFADADPPDDARILAAAQNRFGADTVPDHAALVALADRWRPFRIWAMVLLRVDAERQFIARA